MARYGEATSKYNQSEEESNMEVRKGPWTVDEDFTLINYVARHGEGRWNSLARCAGLKRTGNITLDEQLLILELHSHWGNRWSKIAQHLPGRTDNEIKNYWRTRVQKQANLLKCDSNSKQFKDTLHWAHRHLDMGPAQSTQPMISCGWAHTRSPDNSSVAASSSESFETPVSGLTDGYNNCGDPGDYYYYYYYYNPDYQRPYGVGQPSLMGPMGFYNQGMDFADKIGPGMDSPWNGDDVWFLQQLNGHWRGN